MDTTTPNFATQLPELANGTTIANFTIERFEQIEEIAGGAYIMRHNPTGARTMWLACADNNKAFSIAFKTPPANDTGVFHILEHSVLCGSDKFPVKEPFTNLLKTSMQTFLNAMTFPDKTMYPVASTNEQDLLNLMDVYIDAVLHPAIYHRPRILEQEGWHYELAEDGKTLTYNGVVFNEMKGALSDPEEIMMGEMSRQLFPDTPYRFESGGNPRAIPQLSYKEFIDTHARHYTLPNSYTVLYGNLDIQHVLSFLDERYSAAPIRNAGAPNALPMQQPLIAAPAQITMATTPDNASITLGFVIGKAHDRTRVLGADILMDALMGSNEAPLKRTILDAHLGDDVVSYLMDSVAQPFILIELKGAKPNVADRFRELVFSTCRDLVKNGIARQLIDAALAQAEFNLRESEWGYTPDGVALAMQSLNSWLYNDDDPTSYLHYENSLLFLHDALTTSWYEDLLDEVICSSVHFAQVELIPTDKGDADAEIKELADYAGTLSNEQLTAISHETDALRAEQDAPDSPEALATLPMLGIGDIGPAVPNPGMHLVKRYPAPSYVHEIPTKHINYIYNYFDLQNITWDDLPYVTILTDLLGKLNTATHNAAELDTLVETNLGHLSFFVETNSNFNDANDVHPKLVVGIATLSENLSYAAQIPIEIWSSTQFDDRSRILNALQQHRIGMEQSFIGAGHLCASNRLMSYFRKAALTTDKLNGIDFYQFLCELIDHFDERADELISTLKRISRDIFSASNMELSFTGSDEELAQWWAAADNLVLTSTNNNTCKLQIPEPSIKNEAFIVPGNVVFVAESKDGQADNCTSDGVWNVASRAISLDYLWNEVRVRGGAYGCGFNVTATGIVRFFSYRDPSVDATIQRFENTGEWLKNWNPTKDEFTGYVVSTVSNFDAPIKPRALARRQDITRLNGQDPQLRLLHRNEALHATVEKVRERAAGLENLKAERGICVFGSKALIDASQLDLTIIPLMGGDLAATSVHRA
ncbi:insulinase family protein [Atopobium fossor]|uniref:insulinase family protein n=1 Tax=Atopobium fossor TaxID=39487 RepID=UPI0004053A5F|nr:insulinase family protein [Atopobium fossor]